MANVPGMPADVAAQSCELLLEPRSGFFSDVRMDPQAVQAVLTLRGRLGNAAQAVDGSGEVHR